MANKIVTERLNKKKITEAIKIAKEHLGPINNWKIQCQRLDEALSLLTPAELMTVEDDPTTHKDIVPYIWAHLVDRGFESVWASSILNPAITEKQIEAAKGIECPIGFDPYTFRGAAYKLNDHVRWDGCNPKFNLGYIRGISPDRTQVLVAGWRNPVPVEELSIAPEPHPPLYPPYTENQWTT